MTDIKELRRLAESATQGGWLYGRWGGHCTIKHVGTHLHHGPNHPTDPCIYTPVFSAEYGGIAHKDGSMIVDINYDQLVISDQDSAYIAYANPSAILSLLDKIDAQEKEIKALNKALDEAYP